MPLDSLGLHRLRGGAVLLLLFFVLLTWTRIAEAQFFFPSGKDTPSVRLASRDSFENALSTFRDRIKQRIEERGSQVKRRLELLKATGDEGVTELRERLLAERGLLLRTAELAEQTWELTQSEPLPVVAPQLEDWIAERLHLGELQKAAETALEMVEARREILRYQDAPRVDWMIAKAESDYQEAESFWARARVRQQLIRVDLIQKQLQLTPADLEEANAHKAEVEARIRAQFPKAQAESLIALKAEVKNPEEVLRYGEMAAAEFRSVATARLLGEPTAITSHVETLQEVKDAALVIELAWKRKALSPAKSAQAEAALSRLKKARIYLDQAELYLELAQPKLHRWQQPHFVQRSLMSAGMLVLAMLVLSLGPKLLRIAIAFVRKRLPGWTPSEPKLRKAGAALALIWPMAILVVTASYVLWGIWDSEIHISQAIKLVDKPLFFLDTTPVSIFSLIKLAFAFWAAVVLSRVIRDLFTEHIYPRFEWDTGLTNAVNTLVHYMILLIGGITGLQFVGVGMSSWAILAGILGIGIGFGLRNITENFISGLIILVERPIKIGDFVELGGLEGQIRQIRARSTLMVTRDNITVIIPNSELVSARVTNWSYADPKVRLQVAIRLPYGSDPERAKRVLMEAVAMQRSVLKWPKPEVQMRSFSESSIDILLLYWIEDQTNRFQIESALRFAVARAFKKEELKFAFPQIDLHFKPPVEPEALPETEPPKSLSCHAPQYSRPGLFGGLLHRRPGSGHRPRSAPLGYRFSG